MTKALEQGRGAMERLAAGEDLALNEIMDRWKSRLNAYLYRFTGNESLALDLTEETFVQLYQGRARFRPGANFSSWLFGMAAIITAGMCASPRSPWRPRLPLPPMEIWGQSAELHEREIAALPPDLRKALILSEYEIFLQSGQGCLPSKVFSTACVRDPVLEKSCTIFTQAIP